MRNLFISSVLCFWYVNGWAQLSPEQKVIQNVFFNFLYSYQKQESIFDSFKICTGSGTENGPPYHIQWKEVDRYITFLKKSVPFVGDAYIENERKNFRFYDSCYKDDPKEELAVGFDFDRWAGGQENVAYLVKWHTDQKNIYQVNIKGNSAELRIGHPLWKGSVENERLWNIVPFIKEKGRWVMATNIESIE
ncbi:MAG: hypothetical protein WCR66_07350 [Bacteroidota bacterium]